MLIVIAVLPEMTSISITRLKPKGSDFDEDAWREPEMTSISITRLKHQLISDAQLEGDILK